MRTKVVFAGDAQSGQRGDVDVIQDNGAVWVVFEVKAQQLDALTYESVIRTHTGTGTRDYPVFILAESFKANLEDEYQDVFTVRLRDFCLTILAEIVLTKALTSDEVIRRVLDVYSQLPCAPLLVGKDDGRNKSCCVRTTSRSSFLTHKCDLQQKLSGQTFPVAG